MPDSGMTWLDSTFQEGVYRVKILPVVILDQPWHQVSQAEKELLQKILSALGLTLDSIKLLHQAQLNVSALSVPPDRIIYFGVPTPGVPLYEMITVNNSSIVASDSLRELLTNDDLRKRLWVALKKQFNR